MSNKTSGPTEQLERVEGRRLGLVGSRCQKRKRIQPDENSKWPPSTCPAAPWCSLVMKVLGVLECQFSTVWHMRLCPAYAGCSEDGAHLWKLLGFDAIPCGSCRLLAPPLASRKPWQRFLTMFEVSPAPGKLWVQHMWLPAALHVLGHTELSGSRFL